MPSRDFTSRGQGKYISTISVEEAEPDYFWKVLMIITTNFESLEDAFTSTHLRID